MEETARIAELADAVARVVGMRADRLRQEKRPESLLGPGVLSLVIKDVSSAIKRTGLRKHDPLRDGSLLRDRRSFDRGLRRDDSLLLGNGICRRIDRLLPERGLHHGRRFRCRSSTRPIRASRHVAKGDPVPALLILQRVDLPADLHELGMHRLGLARRHAGYRRQRGGTFDKAEGASPARIASSTSLNASSGRPSEARMVARLSRPAGHGREDPRIASRARRSAARRSPAAALRRASVTPGRQFPGSIARARSISAEARFPIPRR